MSDMLDVTREENNQTVTDAQSRSPTPTPLYDLHLELGAKIVPFAGYAMPVQYPMGVLTEHLHTRTKAGLFDVSHMGQARLVPVNTSDARNDTNAILEALVPGGLKTLKDGQIRYTQLTNETGGILDDLMVTRMGKAAWLVVNAACKENDFKHISQALSGKAVLEVKDRALIALQGPRAAKIIADIFPETKTVIKIMPFMSAIWTKFESEDVLVSRCGYTGEDGFEISLVPAQAEPFARLLLSNAEVEPIGLGARDSLRLEAGLCLYGHDIDTTTTPAEADLLWSVPKRRREEANFPGASVINQQIEQGVARKRVGILPDGRAPAREGTLIQDLAGNVVGTVTSGSFSPSKNTPIAMGYVCASSVEAGTKVNLIVRGKQLPATISALPFVPQNYFKG